MVKKLGVTVLKSATIKATNTTFVISEGSVIDFQGCALVNAANEGCIGGGGVDGACNARGGIILKEARQNLPVVMGSTVRCPTGDAKVTVGGRLDVGHVIHAVGPRYPHSVDLEFYDNLLKAAYKNSMDRGKENSFKTIGFSLLSAGIFRGGQSLSKVLQIAVNTIAENTYDGLEEVYLVAYTATEQDTLIDAFDKWEAEIKDV